MRCPSQNCGHDNPAGSRFCELCGTKLSRTCPSCGVEVSSDARFCMHCGFSLDSGVPSESSPMIGNRNVIAGDVIGSKDDFHISGDATIIKNEDDTRRVKICSLCGRHLIGVDGFTCPRCGRFVCASCYDEENSACVKCVEEERCEATESYRAFLHNEINGPVGALRRSTLLSKATVFGVDADYAEKLLASILKEDSKSKTKLDLIEQGILDKAEKLVLDGASGAMSLIEPLYSKHPGDEEILLCFLSAVKHESPERFDDVLLQMPKSSISVIPFLVDDALNRGALLEAWDIVNDAVEMYPDSAVIKACKVMVLLGNAKTLGIESYMEAAQQLAATLEIEETRPLERLRILQAKSSIFDGGANPVKKEFKAGDEISVSCSGNADFSTISEALASVPEGVTILIQPGIYEEDLHIDKSITLKAGESGSMPIIVTRNGSEVLAPARLIDIAFTDDWSIEKDELKTKMEVAKQLDPQVYITDDEPEEEIRSLIYLYAAGIAIEHCVFISDASSMVLRGISVGKASSGSITNTGIYGCQMGVDFDFGLCGAERLYNLCSLDISSCDFGINASHLSGNLSVVDCRISNCNNGIEADSIPSKWKLSLRGNRFSNCEIGCDIGREAEVSDCEANGCNTGFRLNSVRYTEVSNCIATECDYGFYSDIGIECFYLNDKTFKPTDTFSHIFSRNKKPSHLRFNGCVANCCSEGFTIEEGCEAYFTRCNVENAKEYAVHISGKSTASIHSCFFSGGDTALYVEGSNIEVRDTMFEKCENACAGVFGDSNAEFKTCEFNNSKNYGFFLQDGMCSLKDCSSNLCSVGFACSGKSKCVCTHCNSSNCKEAGYACSDDSNLKCVNCRSNNNAIGYWSYDSATMSLSNCSANSYTYSGVGGTGTSHVILDKFAFSGGKGTQGITLMDSATTSLPVCSVDL